MKKIILCGLTVLFIASCPFPVRAKNMYSIHFEWGYTPPSEPALIGFNLYQEGVKIAEWVGANLNEMDTICNLTAEVTAFTLTAAFNDGTESPHSMPAFMNRNNARPANPTEFKLLSKKGIRVKKNTQLMVASLFFGRRG